MLEWQSRLCWSDSPGYAGIDNLATLQWHSWLFCTGIPGYTGVAVMVTLE